MLNKKIGLILLGMFSIVDLNAIVDSNIQRLWQKFGLAGLAEATKKFQDTYQPTEGLKIYGFKIFGTGVKFFSADFRYDTTSKGDGTAADIYADTNKSSVVSDEAGNYRYQLKFEMKGDTPSVALQALLMKSGIPRDDLVKILDDIGQLVYGYFKYKSALEGRSVRSFGFKVAGKYDDLAGVIGTILNEVLYAYSEANVDDWNRLNEDGQKPLINVISSMVDKIARANKDTNNMLQAFGDKVRDLAKSADRYAEYTKGSYLEDGSALVGELFHDVAQAALFQTQYQGTNRLLPDLKNYEYSTKGSGSFYKKGSLVIKDQTDPSKDGGAGSEDQYAYELKYDRTKTELVDFALGNKFGIEAFTQMVVNIAKSAHGNRKSYFATNRETAVIKVTDLQSFIAKFVTSIIIQAKNRNLSEFIVSDLEMANIIANIAKAICDALEKGESGFANEETVKTITNLIRDEYNAKVLKSSTSSVSSLASSPTDPRLNRVPTRELREALEETKDAVRLLREAQKALKEAQDKTEGIQTFETNLKSQGDALIPLIQAAIDSKNSKDLAQQYDLAITVSKEVPGTTTGIQELTDKLRKAEAKQPAKNLTQNMDNCKKEIEKILKLITHSDSGFPAFKNNLNSAEKNAAEAEALQSLKPDYQKEVKKVQNDVKALQQEFAYIYKLEQGLSKALGAMQGGFFGATEDQKIAALRALLEVLSPKTPEGKRAEEQEEIKAVAGKEVDFAGLDAESQGLIKIALQLLQQTKSMEDQPEVSEARSKVLVDIESIKRLSEDRRSASGSTEEHTKQGLIGELRKSIENLRTISDIPEELPPSIPPLPAARSTFLSDSAASTTGASSARRSPVRTGPAL